MKSIYLKENVNLIFYQLYKQIVAESDIIPGGKSSGFTLNDIAKHHSVDIDDLLDEFKMGIRVEMEHTNNVDVSKEITLDHLYEDPKYYTKLKTIHSETKLMSMVSSPKLFT
jgi:hypothetical protein